MQNWQSILIEQPSPELLELSLSLLGNVTHRNVLHYPRQKSHAEKIRSPLMHTCTHVPACTHILPPRAVLQAAEGAVPFHRLLPCAQRKCSRHLNISKPNKTSWRILLLWPHYLLTSVFLNSKERLKHSEPLLTGAERRSGTRKSLRPWLKQPSLSEDTSFKLWWLEIKIIILKGIFIF